MQLGQRLRALRGARTLKAVAHDANLSLSYLSDIERGRATPTLDTLCRLAAVFEMSLIELLAGVDIAEAAPLPQPQTDDGITRATWRNPFTP